MILVIDDDRELAALLQRVFEREGLQAEFCHDGRKGLDKALHGSYDLLVLDVMLPNLDGFELLRKLRLDSDLPTLMLTARGDDVDRIVGLEAGADDYLLKPFHPREMVARIRAILRRTQAGSSGGSGSGSSGGGRGRASRVIEAADVRLDLGARSVTCAGQAIELTTMEFDLLRALMESAGRVLSREALLDRIDGRQSTSPFDRAIDVHVSHLRRKLGGESARIRTIRGVGYQFVLPSSASE
jgi:two-component system, OmpR family, response regulator CpxR